MSPYPIEPARALGPMRLVLTAYPTAASARKAVDAVIAQRLAACASEVDQRSTFRWKGRTERAAEVLVIFKTAPKTVGALTRFLAATHPYDVPEVVELDVPRVEPAYLAWLTGVVDPSSRAGLVEHPTRPAGPRGRGARAPARTRARRRHPSKRS